MKPGILQIIDTKAEDTSVLHLTGNEEVAGTKNFSVAPQISGSNTAKDSDVVHKSGDTMTGTVYYTLDNVIKRSDDSNSINILGCTDYHHGAHIILSGKDKSATPGEFQIEASTNASDSKYFIGKPDGDLQWRGKRLLTLNGWSANDSATENIVICHETATDKAVSISAGNCANILQAGNISLWGKDVGSLSGCIKLDCYATDDTSCYLLLQNDKKLTWTIGGSYTCELPCPPGTIIWTTKSSAPSGYLICNGAEVSQTTYARLYTEVGNKYGTATTEGNFVLPNLIGKVMWGGTPSNTYTDNYKDAGLPNITGYASYGHSTDYGHFFSDNSNGAFSNSLVSSNLYVVSTSGGTFNLVQGVNFSAQNSNSIYGNSSTVQPPAVVFLPCIKY